MVHCVVVYARAIETCALIFSAHLCPYMYMYDFWLGSFLPILLTNRKGVYTWPDASARTSKPVGYNTEGEINSSIAIRGLITLASVREAEIESCSNGRPALSFAGAQWVRAYDYKHVYMFKQEC